MFVVCCKVYVVCFGWCLLNGFCLFVAWRLFAVCCLLRVVCRLLFAVCCLLFVAYCVLVDVSVLFDVCRLLFWCLLFDGCCVLFVLWCSLAGFYLLFVVDMMLVVCCSLLLSAARCLSPVGRRLSAVVCCLFFGDVLCLLFVVCRVPTFACWLLCVAWCLLFAVRC